MPHDTAPHQEPPPAHDPVGALERPAGRALSTWLLPAGLALALVGLVGGLLLGRGTADPGVPRVADAASLGFVRDMGVHHAQAVQMSEVLHRRSDDPALTSLAFDIMTTQQGQIGIMTAWLDVWGQPHGGDAPAMAWMGHTGPMPGMASSAELARLETLPVPRLEEQWLRLMVRHHRGAVPMAEAGARRAGSPDVARLAQQMAAAQQSEVDAMQDLLTRRGLAPEPEEPGHATTHGDTGAGTQAGAPDGPDTATPAGGHGAHG